MGSKMKYVCGKCCKAVDVAKDYQSHKSFYALAINTHVFPTEVAISVECHGETETFRIEKDVWHPELIVAIVVFDGEPRFVPDKATIKSLFKPSPEPEKKEDLYQCF
jgi:hypothetical protein